MEGNKSPPPKRGVDLSSESAQRPRAPSSAFGQETNPSMIPLPTSDTPVTTPGSSAMLESSTSYTMIYPIRSLLTEVQPSDAADTHNHHHHQQGPQFPPLPPTPSLASASMMDPMKQRFQPESTPGATLHRSTSIQQRRTAQWQANISDRRSSGKLSAPSSPETRSIALKPQPLGSPTGPSTSSMLLIIYLLLTSRSSPSSPTHVLHLTRFMRLWTGLLASRSDGLRVRILANLRTQSTFFIIDSPKITHTTA